MEEENVNTDENVKGFEEEEEEEESLEDAFPFASFDDLKENELVVIKLYTPVNYGSELVEELRLVKPRGIHLRDYSFPTSFNGEGQRLNVSAEVDFAVQLAGYDKKLANKLHAKDFNKLGMFMLTKLGEFLG